MASFEQQFDSLIERLRLDDLPRLDDLLAADRAAEQRSANSMPAKPLGYVHPMAPISLRLEPPSEPVNLFKTISDPKEHIQVLANSTIMTARALQSVNPMFRQGWDHTWANQLGTVCQAMKEAAQANERSFVLHRALPDALIVWWQQQEDCVAQISTATRTACEQVMVNQGGFDCSDATTVLRSEYTFAITLQAIGGLSSLERVGEVLVALDALAADYHHYPKHDNGVCPAIVCFVMLAMPLMLTYTYWLGASVALR